MKDTNLNYVICLIISYQKLMNYLYTPEIHPLLYSRYLLSKISWELTVTDISKTWICETLDTLASRYIRKWLELPISATLSNVFLPRNKFGLNVILPSTKFTQCQTVSRSSLKTSMNEDINKLWSITSTNKNIQYDMYKNTKDLLKADNEQVFGQSTNTFIDMLKDLKFDEQHIKYVKKKIITICIRASYYIFCQRNKDWTSPELLKI